MGRHAAMSRALLAYRTAFLYELPQVRPPAVSSLLSFLFSFLFSPSLAISHRLSPSLASLCALPQGPADPPAGGVVCAVVAEVSRRFGSFVHQWRAGPAPPEEGYREAESRRL